MNTQASIHGLTAAKMIRRGYDGQLSVVHNFSRWWLEQEKEEEGRRRRRREQSKGSEHLLSLKDSVNDKSNNKDWAPSKGAHLSSTRLPTILLPLV